MILNIIGGVGFGFALASICGGAMNARAADRAEPAGDPAEVAIGERLFRETRFNQYFATHFEGDVNQPLAQGDPVLEQLPSLKGPFKNPYAGAGMNCASCHFVDEAKASQGNNAYGDFARRSPIPDRGDGKRLTLRNSPAFVNSTLALEEGYRGNALFLHFDGEFVTVEDLVRGGFTGRNFGWLAGEAGLATAHLARVVREDDGSGALARESGGSYARVLAGTDPSLPAGLTIPAEYRIDVAQASDQQVLDAVAKLVGAYLKSIVYSRDPETDEFDGSPYDVFLRKNGLPRKPAPGQTDRQYAEDLARRLEQLPLEQVRFVEDGVDGKFGLSTQTFAFGNNELAGLKAFLGRANCAACHTPPSFTDFGFHNTGVAQDEYDSIHGRGMFSLIEIPTFAERLAREEEVFGPSARHPRALGKFSSIPSLEQPGFADLGVWSVFGNPAVPQSQTTLKRALCRQYAGRERLSINSGECTDEQALSAAVASFKTSTVRNLGMSAPYMHTGQMDRLEDTVLFYMRASSLARMGELRNPDPEMLRMLMNGREMKQLVAFMRALSEDYE